MDVQKFVICPGEAVFLTCPITGKLLLEIQAVESPDRKPNDVPDKFISLPVPFTTEAICH